MNFAAVHFKVFILYIECCDLNDKKFKVRKIAGFTEEKNIRIKLFVQNNDYFNFCLSTCHKKDL